MLPSELLEQALDDLELCMKEPGYKIDMKTWHTPGKTKCFVCLAGAYLAQTCKVPRHISMFPSNINDEKLQMQLYALDLFRVGSVENALHDLGFEPGPKDRSIPPYSFGPEQFITALRTLVEELKEHERNTTNC